MKITNTFIFTQNKIQQKWNIKTSLLLLTSSSTSSTMRETTQTNIKVKANKKEHHVMCHHQNHTRLPPGGIVFVQKFISRKRHVRSTGKPTNIPVRVFHPAPLGRRGGVGSRMYKVSTKHPSASSCMPKIKLTANMKRMIINSQQRRTNPPIKNVLPRRKVKPRTSDTVSHFTKKKHVYKDTWKMISVSHMLWILDM